MFVLVGVDAPHAPPYVNALVNVQIRPQGKDILWKKTMSRIDKFEFIYLQTKKNIKDFQIFSDTNHDKLSDQLNIYRLNQ